jgi:hypothetical protein
MGTEAGEGVRAGDGTATMGTGPSSCAAGRVGRSGTLMSPGSSGAIGATGSDPIPHREQSTLPSGISCPSAQTAVTTSP